MLCFCGFGAGNYIWRYVTLMLPYFSMQYIERLKLRIQAQIIDEHKN